MNRLPNRLWRTFRATLWYFIVMWLGIAYFWLIPNDDWKWYALMLPYAFVIWVLVSKLREWTHF